MDLLDLVQWPAMATTLIAAWLVAAKHMTRRNKGFWLFLLSNLLWVIWAIPSAAYALVVLQLGLAVSNVRGILKIRRESAWPGPG